MKGLAKISIVLGAITVLVGYTTIVVNIINLRKNKKLNKLVD